MRRAARATSSQRYPTDKRSDEQQTRLPNAANAEAQTADKLGENYPCARAMPAATAAPAEAPLSTRTSATTPAISAQQSKAIPPRHPRQATG